MLKITIFNEETHETSIIENIEACVLLTGHEKGTAMRAEGDGRSLFKIVAQWEEFGESLMKRMLAEVENQLPELVKTLMGSK